jgi:hypothetical protein
MSENLFVVNCPDGLGCCVGKCGFTRGQQRGCTCPQTRQRPVTSGQVRPVHNAQDLLPLPEPDWQEWSGRKPEPVLTANQADPSILPLPSIEDLVGNGKAEGSNADSPDDDRGWVPPWQRPLLESSDYPWGSQRPTSTMYADGLMTNSRDVLPLPGVPDWSEIAALPGR